jgi:uncharacterized protein YdaU (DUF1376 family)
VNHYPHHLGDYAKDTLALSMLEHGAYRLLIDAYYASEQAIPAEDVYGIARATSASERKAVDKVLKKFELRDGRYYHKRIEEEIAAYRVRSKQATENVRKRYQRPTEPLPPPSTDSVLLASSHKPVTSNQEPKQRIPDANHSPESAGARGAAALEGLKAKALTLEETKIPGGEETPAGHLSSVLRANGLRGNAFHPLVVEWAREGVTVERLKDAVAKARQRPGKEKGVFGPEYLDPILRDETKPAVQVQAEKVAQVAAHNVERTKQIIAEQQTREVAPMPEHLRPKPTSH